MSRFRQGVLRAARRLELEPHLRRAQRGLARGASRRGYIDDEHTALLMALGLPADSSCIDIGANVGTVLDDIVRLFPGSRHLAFEPLPELAAALTERFPSVDVRNIALSDHVGAATFSRVVKAPGHSGLGKFGDSHGPIERFEIGLTTLDEALPDDFVPAFIKIDVEGAEEQVFRGMLGTLQRHRPLVVFEHGDHASRFDTTSDAIHDLLCTRAGLRLFDIDGNGPFERDGFSRRVAEGELWTWVARS